MFVASTAWLPWMLCGIERFSVRRRVDDALWIGLSGGLALLAGGWSMLLWGGVVIAIYAVAAIAEPRPPPTGHRRGRSRARGRRARRRRAAGVRARRRAARRRRCPRAPIAARARRRPGRSPRATPGRRGATAHAASSPRSTATTRAAPTSARPISGSCAATASAPSPACWRSPRSARRDRRGERIALFVAVLVACDLARGAGGALFPLLFKLPLFSSLRCPARALYIWTLAAPHPRRRRARRPRRPTAAPRAALAAPARRSAPSSSSSPSPSAPRTRRPRSPPPRRAPPPSTGCATTARPAAAPTTCTSATRSHNMGLRWRIESAGGYHSLPIWRYLHLLWIANHGAPYPHAQLADDLTGQGLWRFASPHRRSAQRRVTSGARAIVPSPPRLDAASSPATTASTCGATATPFRAPSSSIARREVAGEAAAARAVASRRVAPGARRHRRGGRSICRPPIGRGAARRPRRCSSSAKSRPRSVEVPLAHPALLVVTEPWYPGWRVTVDGKPAPLCASTTRCAACSCRRAHHLVDLELTSTPLANRRRDHGRSRCFAMAIVTAMAPASPPARRDNGSARAPDRRSRGQGSRHTGSRHRRCRAGRPHRRARRQLRRRPAHRPPVTLVGEGGRDAVVIRGSRHHRRRRRARAA